MAITSEGRVLPPPRNLRDLIAGVDAAATLALGGAVAQRPPADDRSVHAADVLAALG